MIQMRPNDLGKNKHIRRIERSRRTNAMISIYNATIFLYSSSAVPWVVAPETDHEKYLRVASLMASPAKTP